MIEVAKPGLQTTVQDLPGRIGYWHVGIPPSGPMDPLAFCIGNILVGNAREAAGLEMTALGPTLRFLDEALIALTGAAMVATLDGEPVPLWTAVTVRPGGVLTLGAIQGAGLRTYLLVRGGINVPPYLGSRATFPFGHLGGLEGRPLQPGDILPVGADEMIAAPAVPRRLPARLVPHYAAAWTIRVLPGPHEAPDFFTPEGAALFYETGWVVHHNSNRLGYRLIGPKLAFARADGGEGGPHPSNIHDCAYAIGTINVTGDVPIILTVDGPSLGGFVSIATVITADLWRVGQARANDVLHFRSTTLAAALRVRRAQQRMLADLGRVCEDEAARRRNRSR